MERQADPSIRPAVDRRVFLKAAGALGLGAVAGGLLQSAYRVVRLDRMRLQVEKTVVRMGTYVTMTVVDGSRDRAEHAIGRAIAEMDRLVGMLSRHEAGSVLSTLNRDGALMDAPAELVDVVRQSLWVHRASGGAFDITVKPVLDLLADSFATRGCAPDDRAVRAALARVGSERVEVREHSIRFAAPGMGVSLDGIAKGFVVDRMSDVLSAAGVSSHLVNAGGDMRARGARAGGKPWRIAIEDPEKRGRYRGVIQLGTGAVATSGDYEIYYDREKIHHHIVDPSTGASPLEASSVTVVAGSAAQSDALSTAVFVLGPEKGPALVGAMGGPACCVIDRRGDTTRSRGWDALTAESPAGVNGTS